MNLATKSTIGGATALAAVFLVAAGTRQWGGEACAAPPKPPEISFSDDVLPLLQFRCGSCHLPGGAGIEKSGFDVSSYATMMQGTKFGPMIIPGDPENSNLMRLLDWRVPADIQMPHGKRQLSVCDRDMIRTWIF